MLILFSVFSGHSQCVDYPFNARLSYDPGGRDFHMKYRGMPFANFEKITKGKQSGRGSSDFDPACNSK